MAEYIEREALLSDIDAAMDNSGMGYVVGQTLKRYIKRKPAADVVPVRRGHWIGEWDGYADGEIVLDVWYCSECNYCIDDGTDDPAILPKYCQNCGAKMDGGADHA